MSASAITDMTILEVIKAHRLTLNEVRLKMPLKDNGEPISSPAMSQLVNGNPTLSRLQDIAHAMGMTTAQLLAEVEGTEVGVTPIVCPKCGARLRLTAE